MSRLFFFPPILDNLTLNHRNVLPGGTITFAGFRLTHDFPIVFWQCEQVCWRRGEEEVNHSTFLISIVFELKCEISLLDLLLSSRMLVLFLLDLEDNLRKLFRFEPNVGTIHAFYWTLLFLEPEFECNFSVEIQWNDGFTSSF